MNWFNILVGCSTIGAFIIAIIALFKVNKIEKQIINSHSTETNQTIENSKVQNSDIIQVGRDYAGDK